MAKKIKAKGTDKAADVKVSKEDLKAMKARAKEKAAKMQADKASKKRTSADADDFGCKAGSVKARINKKLLKGQTYESLVKWMLDKNIYPDEAKCRKEISRRFWELRRDGYNLEKNGNKYTLIPGDAPAAVADDEKPKKSKKSKKEKAVAAEASTKSGSTGKKKKKKKAVKEAA